MRGSMSGSQGLLRALLRLFSKEVKQYVGTDQFGNKYFYIPERKNWLGQTMRERRFVEARDKKEVDYREGDIPMEWEAWIRKTRKSPPTIEIECSQFHQSLCAMVLHLFSLLIFWTHSSLLMSRQREIEERAVNLESGDLPE
ncbi:NADH dehydrogenase [ubiquinone] 1 alpha subcomplex assembly factor 2 isoform X1 [Vombatus ursinus]|uniref:NADH dehydrogenase [ubiquinone] 1 alpha subcomplex assembly factor 2 isoform X1 n=1 Tax=Vombatus ursinus TaxID=29139 RepID=UPI000FFDA1FA|nr:NADH dehydrogenase [ubiquinone] 1 alpha subcomplex assembly factor 2 isoform X1 [Vombatus ursinus]